MATRMNQPGSKVSARWAQVVLLGVALAGSPGAAVAALTPDTDWLIFLSAAGMRTPSTVTSLLPDPHGEIAADVLYTSNHGSVRFLFETEVSSDDTGIDRLQVGWEFAEDSYFWLGKFHQPASAWNFGHDHGHYLQTAITVPVIERWEDQDGLPQDMLGALVDLRRPIASDRSLAVSIGVGLVPNPHHESNESEPYWEPFMRDPSTHLSSSARVAYYPDAAGASNVGLVWAQNHLGLSGIEVPTLATFDSLRQTIVGAYVDWTHEPWRVLAAAYHLDLQFTGATDARHESFGAGYIQAEYQFARQLTAFARHDNSVDAADSRYFVAFGPSFPVRRNGAGVRWDVRRNVALTIEAARSAWIDISYSEFHLQLSAVVP